MGIKDDFFTYRTGLEILQRNIEVLKNLLNQKVESLDEDDLKNRYSNIFVDFIASMQRKWDDISKRPDKWKWTIEFSCNFMASVIRELHNYLIEEPSIEILICLLCEIAVGAGSIILCVFVLWWIPGAYDFCVYALALFLQTGSTHIVCQILGYCE